MTAALSDLLDTITLVTARPGALDTKLAEYAFVPVSQVLRLSRQVSVRALELCLECVSALLRSGWGGGLEPALSGQLLILFTFLAKPSSADNGIAATSEELQTLSFKCIGELLDQSSRSETGREALTATGNIPALGEAVLITLESLAGTTSNHTKIAAVNVVKRLTVAVADDDALASFFPKIVSSLTKILTPGSTNKAGYRVIELGLDSLTLLFLRLLSDSNTKNLSVVASTNDADVSHHVSRSTSWLQATASQIKIALANIYKMRNHDKSEVRRALLNLCLCVLRDCRISLGDSVSMSIETVVGLVGKDGQNNAVETELKTTLLADHKLADLLRESLHDWVVSFPRVMQSKNDDKRRLIIHQISVTLRILGSDLADTDSRLADGLRDGLSAVLADSKGLEELGSGGAITGMEAGMVLGPSRPSSFQPLQLRLKGQQDLMSEFGLLISQLAKSDSALNIVQDLVQDLGSGLQEKQLASYWVSVNLIRDLTITAPSLDDFIILSSNPREGSLDDLYSHSLTLLTEQSPTTSLSWHFYALAMETVALQAGRYKMDFRAELGEVLYPILHQLGSPNPALREHAITCLNIISDACGYTSARDLVVGNVDYVVNAVGLKLAVGDVSPQAPQVLLMMMRLCGPSLLPYLDDLVKSIFEALERYHGYPRLVELLFSVLKGMTEEGTKAPLLAIEGPSSLKRAPLTGTNIPISDVVLTLQQMRSDKLNRTREAALETPTPFPQKPWKEEGLGKDPADTEDQPPPEQPEQSPPAPRTYQILLSVSELTQHYLTSASPTLRTSLLALLKTTIPALAKHEDTFLPLINTLWPMLLPRLQDPEAYIVSNTLEVIGVMCEHAGSFMRSRIESAFDILKKVHRRTQERNLANRSSMRSKTKSLQGGFNISHVSTGLSSLSISSTPTTSTQLDRPELYTSAPSRMIWDALVGCLCAIASHVALRDEQFEELLDILDPVLSREDVNSALNRANADAVWLRLYKKQREQECKVVYKTPETGGRWNFIVL